MRGDALESGCLQTLQQLQATAEALAEIQISRHGRCGDARHLFSHTRGGGKLVDDLALDQRGIHVEGHEATVAAVDVVFLEGDVHSQLAGDLHKAGAQVGQCLRLSARHQFDAGAARSPGLVEGHAS